MLKLDTCKISVQLHTFIYVFLSQLIFIFPLLLDMVMYANEFETKLNKGKTKSTRNEKLTVTFICIHVYFE